MTTLMREYSRIRQDAARAACREFITTVDVRKKPKEHVDQTMRAIRYIVTRMGRNSVITDQIGSNLLGHIQCFARKEVKRAAEKGRR
jgi:hypothetical protein